MCSLKIYLDTRSLPEGKSYPLVISLSCRGSEKVLPTPYSLPLRNFDSQSGRAVFTGKGRLTKRKLNQINAYINREVMILESIISSFEPRLHYILSDIVNAYHSKGDSGILKNYVENLLPSHCCYDNELSKYFDLLSLILHYIGENHLLRLDDITKEWISCFRAYIDSENYSQKESRSYLRFLHRICVFAREDGLYNINPDPFRSHTSPSRLSEPEYKASEFLTEESLFDLVSNASLSERSDLELYRDLFVFSYQTHGMPFREMALLTAGNIYSDHLCYCRVQLNGDIVSIKLTPSLRKLIAKYSGQSNYLFPIYESSDISLDNQYSIYFRRYKMQLKELAFYLGISVSLLRVLSQKRHSYNDLRISISLSGEKKKIKISCQSNSDIRSQVLHVLNELIADGLLAV